MKTFNDFMGTNKRPSPRDLTDAEIAEKVRELRKHRHKPVMQPAPQGPEGATGPDGATGPEGTKVNVYDTGDQPLRVVFYEKQITIEVTPGARRIATWSNGNWANYDWAIDDGMGWKLVKDIDKKNALEQKLWKDRNFNIDSLMADGKHLFDYQKEFVEAKKESEKHSKKILQLLRKIEQKDIEYNTLRNASNESSVKWDNMKRALDEYQIRLNKITHDNIQLKKELKEAEQIILNKKPWWHKLFK